MNDIHLVEISTESECERCFNVMRELRTNLSDAQNFSKQVMQQLDSGYRLLAGSRGHQVIALAGYRFQQNLMHGHFIYVDDLVVANAHRGTGIGAVMLDAVRARGREAGCNSLLLDTGLGMARAQRFYFREGLLSRSMGFRESLVDEVAT